MLPTYLTPYTMAADNLPSISKLAVVLGLALGLLGCGGPMGPFAGGKLSGPVNSDPIASWAFAADVEEVQLETQPSDPHSVNTWIGVVDNKLYIPTSLILGEENPSERAWVQHVLADPNVRLRINDKVYLAHARRVMDTATVEAVKEIMLAKYDEQATAHSDGAWVFELQAR